MPNKRKPATAAVRRARRKEGEQRLKNLLYRSTEACGAASRICHQLENENWTLRDAARCPRGNRERQQPACPLSSDLNLIPSIMEIIELSISTCHSARGAPCAHRCSADLPPDTSPGPSDDSSNHSPRSGSGGSRSISPAPVFGSPAPLSPSVLTRAQTSWPGSPWPSPDD
jgi:hypothetical protein